MRACIILLLLCFSVWTRADLAVIASAKSDIPEISLPILKGVYMGNLKYLNGSRVLPLDHMQGNDERKQFYSQAFAMPMNQILAHWSRLVFTGKGQSPIQVADSAAIYQLVKSNKNMIGYIPFENVTPEVRVILRIKTKDF